MVDKNRLKGTIVEKGFSQSRIAEIIGITPKTFYTKMAKGVFGSDEIEIMMEILDIENPKDIFFATKVSR